MKFSIIIPAKNELANLRKLLPQYRALRGTFDYELIIADGASDDGSIEFVRTVADRVEVKTKQGRETIGEGRNRGAAVATGDVFVFFDAGIIVPEIVHFFEVVREVFADERVVAATTNVRIEPKRALVRDRVVHEAVNGIVRISNALGLGAGKGEVQIVRATAFRQLSGYNEALAAAEDNDFFRRLSKIGTIVFLNELEVYDDPRRYRRLGYVRVVSQWILNQLSVMLTGKAYSKEWKRVD